MNLLHIGQEQKDLGFRVKFKKVLLSSTRLFFLKYSMLFVNKQIKGD